VSGPAQLIIACSLIGGLAIWLRAAMLKPKASAWASAPGVVSLALSGLGILMVVLAIGFGRERGRPSYDELMGWLAALVVANMIAGLVLLINLWLQHRRGPPAPSPAQTPV
jgi:hypothetical protein